MHRPQHRRVKQQASSIVPLPRPRPSDAPAAPLQGTAAKEPKTTEPEKGVAEKPPPAPVLPPEPAKPSTAEAAKTSEPAPAPKTEPPKQITEEPMPAPVPQPSACRLALSDAIAIAPSIPDIHGPGDCGGEDLVRLEAVVLADKRRVALKPAAILRCKMASEIADWVRSDVAPLAANLGSEVSTLDNLDSYECRGRNGIPGAKLSEHGHADALDVHALGLANGQSIVLTDRAVPRELRENVLHSACTRFTTVLGPGSDGYHEEHIHLDLMERRNNYRICQWNVYDPMPQIAPLLPATRPDDAPPRQAANSEEATPEAARSEDAEPNNVRPHDAKPDPAASAQAKSERTRPGQAKSDATKSVGANMSVRDLPTNKPPTNKPPIKKRRTNRRC